MACDSPDLSYLPRVIGRRSFLGSVTSVTLAAVAGCSRREQRAAASDPIPPPIATKLPEKPPPDATARPRGHVGTETWTFDNGGRAVVIVPSWLEPTQKLPVLFALHGRGEANKGPVEGVMGWPRDYALLRAIERVCAPPLTSADLEGFVDPKRLAELNAELAAQPFKGMVVVCPYLPDVDLRRPAPIKDYGKYLLEVVRSREHAQFPDHGPTASGAVPTTGNSSVLKRSPRATRT